MAKRSGSPLRRVVIAGVVFGLLTSLLLHGTVAAEIWPGGGGLDPRDARCPEIQQTLPGGQQAAYAPWYQYEVPLLLSDDSEQHRRWLGWFYAPACAANPQRKGRTWANLVVEDGPPDSIATGTLAPVAQALPESVRVPDPDIGALLVPAPAALRETVPRSVAERLVHAGFPMVRGRDGKDHILIDTGRSEYGGHADAFIEWWPLTGQGGFYLHDPAGFAADHPEEGGGIMRVHLGPVNLVLSDGRLLTDPLPGAPVRVQATVANHSNHIVHTNFGWRFTDDPPEQWHEALTGDLTPWVQGPVSFDVPVRDGMLQVAVNYRHDMPDGETTYDDNVVEIPVQTRVADLLLLSLDGPAGPVPPADPPDLREFSVTATVRNTGPYDVTTDVRLTMTNQFFTDALVAQKTVTIPAGADIPVLFSVMSSAPGDVIHLLAVLDPDHGIAPSHKSKDRATLDVPVQRTRPPVDPGNPGGVDDVLIH